MPILNQLDADQKPILGQFHLQICRCKANRERNSANRMPILNQPEANPKKAIFLFHFTNLSIHANLCQSLPIRANPCQSGANWRPIHANPCESMPIRCQFFHPAKLPILANMCQSDVNVSAQHTFSDPVPIHAQFFNNFQRPIHANHGQFIVHFPIRHHFATLANLTPNRQYRATRPTQCQSAYLLFRQFKGHPPILYCISQKRSRSFNLEHTSMQQNWKWIGKALAKVSTIPDNQVPISGHLREPFV